MIGDVRREQGVGRLVARMWVLSFAGAMAMGPVYDVTNSGAGLSKPYPLWILVAVSLWWLVPFALCVASWCFAWALIRTGGTANVLGGLSCILLLSWVPPVMAVGWWIRVLLGDV